MRKCQACNYEMQPGELSANNCPKCGALLRKLAQRTIDDKQIARDRNAQTAGADDITYQIELDESLELQLTDTDQGGQTIDVSALRAAKTGQQSEELPPITFEIDAGGRKSPTLG